MSQKHSIVRTASAFDLRSDIFEEGQVPIYPSTLIHHYICLDIKHEVEFATTKENARRYLQAVATAASIVQYVARQPEFDGLLLEPQGSTIHAAIPYRNNYTETAVDFGSAVHRLFDLRLAPGHSCVTGWRMTADVGNTLVIAGRGVHGDRSLVSIGNGLARAEYETARAAGRLHFICPNQS